MSGDQAEQLGLVADELRASADELAWRQVAVCRKFPSYGKVPDEDLHRSCLRNVFRVVETLHGRDILPAGVHEDEWIPSTPEALSVAENDPSGTARFVVLVLMLIATAVIVTVAMFQTLYIVMG